MAAEAFSRRRFVATALIAGFGVRPTLLAKDSPGVWVNDVHSRLTRTKVLKIARPSKIDDLPDIIASASKRGISYAGGRHSMGAQAFGTDTLHLDLRGLNQVGDLDTRRGIVDVQGGTTWPKLVETLDQRQPGIENPWCIVQKQTGADSLTLGGTLAANAHGRGLNLAPIIQDVESFDLLTAEGDLIECSRTKNPDWFKLAIGGYGLFGIITSIRLRLMRRKIVQRRVKLTTIEDVAGSIDAEIAAGALYGDFQFATAAESDGFLREGVFSRYYTPANSDAATAESIKEKRVLSPEQWAQFIVLAHTEKARAFQSYLDYYLKTDGQIYASDLQQMSTYLPDYHEVISRATRHPVPQSLIITELYVPRDQLKAFFDTVRDDMRARKMDLVYGVVRWIKADRESFLPWAREDFACIIFNLNVQHSREGKKKAAADFRRLIDHALSYGGSYYLTYHKYATKQQVSAAYPQFEDFLAEKEQRDPAHLWRSDWWAHQRQLFA